MTLRKRGSTLFPYTTLFRSGRSLGDTLIKIGKKIGPWMVRIKDRIATDIKEWNVERKEKRQEKSAVKAQQKELAAHEETVETEESPLVLHSNAAHAEPIISSFTENQIYKEELQEEN